MKRVRRLILACALAGVVAGCARPVVVDNGVQRRVFIPCTNDFCLHNSYDIAWQRHDYPVSYRSRQVEFARTPVEYGFIGNHVTLWENALMLP